jgi:hypothetical protein
MQHHSIVPGQSFESSVLSKLCVSLCSVIMVKVLVHISDVSHVKPSAYVPPSTWNQVSHPYEATGKVIFLYIMILILMGRKLKDKRFCTEWQHAFPDIELHNLINYVKYRFVELIHSFV